MRRPGNKCLDCGQKLEEKDNYCPNCGQENSEKQLSLKNLLEDFLSNYFSFDSKLGRSLWFFFLKPGYLTSSYNEGKRIRYIRPLRLYLIITFLFF